MLKPLERPNANLENMRGALLLNLHSRKARKDPNYLSNLKKIAGSDFLYLETDSIEGLKKTVSALRVQKITDVAISGGDGTLRQTLQVFLDTYDKDPLPRFAFLRGGTMNTVCTSLGLTKDPENAFIELVSLYRQKRIGPLLRQSLLSANGVYGFLFGVGGFGRFIELYEENPDNTPLSAFVLLSRVLLSGILNTQFHRDLFVPFQAHITADGKEMAQKTWIALSAATVQDIGFHFRPYVHAASTEFFSFLSFKSFPRGLVFEFHRLLRGQAVRSDSVFECGAREIFIHMDYPQPMMMDGDLLSPSSQIQLKLGPTIELHKL